jgi:hypothetical protein
MQLFPHTMCPDMLHKRWGDTELDGVPDVQYVGGGWTGMGYKCRTCGMQTMRRVIETRLDWIKVTCPGCDAIRLDWDDAPTLCSDCRLREVRATWVALEPNDLLDELFPEYPNLNWTWPQIIRAMS